MTPEAEAEIRALLKTARLDVLADVAIACELSSADVRRLALAVTAYLDTAPERVMPDFAEIAALPAPVVAAARALVAEAVADATDHVPPSGRPN